MSDFPSWTLFTQVGVSALTDSHMTCRLLWMQWSGWLPYNHAPGQQKPRGIITGLVCPGWWDPWSRSPENRKIKLWWGQEPPSFPWAQPRRLPYLGFKSYVEKCALWWTWWLPAESRLCLCGFCGFLLLICLFGHMWVRLDSALVQTLVNCEQNLSVLCWALIHCARFYWMEKIPFTYMSRVRQAWWQSCDGCSDPRQ